jgi:ATP-dependent RNA circularization protein (DNA/RNA ligase family)
MKLERTITLEKESLRLQIDYLNKIGLDFLPQGMSFDEYFAMKSIGRKSENFYEFEDIKQRSERLVSEIQALIQRDAFEDLPSLEEAEEVYEKHKVEFNKEEEVYLFTLAQIWIYLSLVKTGIKPMAIMLPGKGVKEENDQRLKRVIGEFKEHINYLDKLEKERKHSTKQESK